MILTEIGEVGVVTDAGTAVLRPSLYAMSRLGTPARVVELFALVMGDAGGRPQRVAARAVIASCGGDDDQDLLADVFGGFVESDGELKETHGADPESLLPIARCLLRHGIASDLEPEGDGGGEYSAEFVARDYVAAAMAHLGLTEREAWGMTMTGLVAALRSKFPRVEGGGRAGPAKAPSKVELEQTLEWHDKVLEMRRAASV